jgi:hypothetical protein
VRRKVGCERSKNGLFRRKVFGDGLWKRTRLPRIRERQNPSAEGRGETKQLTHLNSQIDLAKSSVLYSISFDGGDPPPHTTRFLITKPSLFDLLRKERVDEGKGGGELFRGAVGEEDASGGGLLRRGEQERGGVGRASARGARANGDRAR